MHSSKKQWFNLFSDKKVFFQKPRGKSTRHEESAKRGESSYSFESFLMYEKARNMTGQTDGRGNAFEKLIRLVLDIHAVSTER